MQMTLETKTLASAHSLVVSKSEILVGAIHGWGTPFGRLTENNFFWITSHAWYA
jgi:phosphate/sulfate permease